MNIRYWDPANDPTVYEYDKQQIEGTIDSAEDSLQGLGKDLGHVLVACCSEGINLMI